MRRRRPGRASASRTASSRPFAAGRRAAEDPTASRAVEATASRAAGELMETIEVSGLEIAYRRSGDGPPIVFLHGTATDSRVWRTQLDELADGFTVVAWDEPGAGGSSDPPEDFGLARYADALAAFLAALGLGRAHVAGLSWGGVLAQELYRRHPGAVASLILAGTYAGWKGSLSKAEGARRVVTILEQTSVPEEDFAAALHGLFGEHPPAGVVAELDAIMADARAGSVRSTSLALAGDDRRELLSQIEVPTLLIWGESDVRSPLHVADQLRENIPGARLVVIPGAGHVSNMEQPTAFNRRSVTSAPRWGEPPSGRDGPDRRRQPSSAPRTGRRPRPRSPRCRRPADRRRRAHRPPRAPPLASARSRQRWSRRW
jgi:pimeloyl-ACP methyl ester carboxylesterase